MIDDIDKILAKNVTSLRNRKGWTREMLATFADLSDGAIAKIETCERWPGILTIKKIANALGVPQSMLFADPELVSFDVSPTETQAINLILEKMGYKPISLKKAGKWPKKNSPE